jgi:hypothetical protein
MTASVTTPPDTAVDEAYYIYGIVPADASVEGIGDSLGMGDGVELLAEGPVAAVVERIDPSQPLGRRKHLVAHSEVLNALAVLGPVLPMRFGAVVDGATAVVDELLGPQGEHFASMLEQSADTLQFTVRARYVLDTVLEEVVRAEPEIAELRRRTAGMPEDASHSERVRLGELVAQAVEARRLQDEQMVRDRLAPYAENHVTKHTSGMDGLTELSFEVRRDREVRFAEVAEALAEEMDGRARISLVGPMALYDFIPEV